MTELNYYAEKNKEGYSNIQPEKYLVKMLYDGGEIVPVTLTVVEQGKVVTEVEDEDTFYGIYFKDENNYTFIFPKIYLVEMCSNDFFKNGLKKGEVEFVRFKLKKVI